MNIRYRPMNVADAIHICHLSGQLGYTISQEETEDNIRNAIHLDHFVLIASYKEKVIGWAHAYKITTIESPPFVELAGLVVDEHYRSQGIGAQLVLNVRNWCKLQQVKKLRVRSNVIRERAHSFYLKLGFKEVKTQKNFELAIEV